MSQPDYGEYDQQCFKCRCQLLWDRAECARRDWLCEACGDNEDDNNGDNNG